MLEIEIFSDVICPWCFIGKRRLDRALTGPLGEGISLRWRPYLLYPNVPEEGVNRAALLRQRYGEDADTARVPQRILDEAKDEGIALRYDLIETTPNTRLAHCLLEYAHTQGLQHELAEALFLAYFCHGRDVGDAATLVAIAGETGLSREGAEQYLVEGFGMNEVSAQLARAPELGISGVPGYFLASSFLLPGAQTSDVMGQIIGRVKEKLALREG